MHSITEVKLSADFWLKSTSDYGVSYQAAFDEPLAEALLWCQLTSRLAGEWLEFKQEDQDYIVCLQAGKLAFVAYFSTHWPEISPSWLAHVFAQQQLSFAAIQSLLLGIASNEFNHSDAGRQVCSCFNVGEKTIVNAIAQGCTSVEQLGEQLQCGTQCGSCKPELASMLSLHKATDSLRVTELGTEQH